MILDFWRNHRVCVFSHVWLFCDPMDCSPPGSSVHGIFQARITGMVHRFFSRGSSWPRDGTHISYVSCIGKRTRPHVPPGKPRLNDVISMIVMKSMLLCHLFWNKALQMIMLTGFYHKFIWIVDDHWQSSPAVHMWRLLCFEIVLF